MSAEGARQEERKRAEHGWRSAAADEVVRAIAAYAILSMAALVAAFFAINIRFGGYDDEGTLLVSLAGFLDGDTLYRDVYSPYGPFYFELFGGFFELSGVSVTNDAGRTIVIVIWVATSVVIGLVCQRLASSLVLGLSGSVVAFAVLYVLIAEPMHPHGLCVLLIGSFFLIAVTEPRRRPVAMGAAAGAILGALILTKLNIGVFLSAAAVMAAVLAWEPLFRQAWLRWLIIAAFISMPLLVLARDVGQSWVRDLLILQVAAGVAIIIASWPNRPDKGEKGDQLGSWLVGGVAGLAAALVAILVVVFATGASPNDVYDGVITQAFRVRDALVAELPVPSQAPSWAVLAIAGAVASVLLRDRAFDSPSCAPGLARALAGLVIWLTVAKAAPLGFNPVGNQIILPMLLAWVAVIPVRGVPESPFKRFVRILLPAAAVAETLQVYPVAGSQVGIAALIFVPVGGVCLADAVVSLRRWNETREQRSRGVVPLAMTLFAATLLSMLVLNQVILPAADNAVTYRDQQPLPFDGASQLRLPADQAAEYEALVDRIEENRCSSFIGFPNINSLYLWTGIKPPLPASPGAWPTALEADEQARVVRQLEATPRPCAIRNETVAATWLAGRPIPRSPLAAFIFDDFVPVEELGASEFMLPTDRP